MAEIATAWVQIVPSARGIATALERELDAPARKSGESAGRTFAERFESSSGRSLKDFGKSALVGAAAFGVGLLGVSKAAGNLDAALSANTQVLKESAGTVQAWAKTSVESVGLSERATLQAATAFGQLGKVAGLTGEPLAGFSVDMVKLAADMAAFADVPADQAVQDLRAAFAGSTETVQKYNIFLNETELKAALFRATGEKVTGVLTAQQRVLATQAALLEQTADIQGQAARESDGFQRAQDNLRATLENTAASIGASTLPAVTNLTRGVTAAIGGVGALNDASGGLVGGLLLVGTTALGAGGSIAIAADKVSGAVAGFQRMSRATQIASIATAGVTAAAVAGFVIYDRWRRKQEDIRARTAEVATALGDQVWETFRLADASRSATGEVDGLAAAQKALASALTAGEDGQRLAEALGAIGVSASRALDVLVDVQTRGVPALGDLASEAELTATELEFVQLALIESGGDLRRWAESTGSAEAALEETNPRLAELVRELRSTRDGAAVVSPEMFRVGDALAEVNRQAGRNDLAAQADQFLNAAAAGADLTEQGQELAASLVDQARAATTASDGTYDAVAAYLEFGRLVGELTPAQRDLIDGIDRTTSAVDDVTTGLAQFDRVAASSLNVITRAEAGFERAADQASAFGSAIDRLVGTQIDLQKSGDDLLAGYAELSKIVTETAAGTEGFSTSLDATSEAGRANREVVRRQAEAILDYSRGLLDAGRSVDEASAAALANTGQLERQLVQFGLTEAEAAAYVETLGLTPESIATAVELYNAEAARTRVEELIESLGEIPAEVASQVQALIDEGDYAEAERRLQFLARDRYVPIRPATGRGGGNAFFANGLIADRPTAGVFGEDGIEAILPLTKPEQLRGILTDPRVYGAVVSALPTVPIGSTGGGDRKLVGVEVENMFVGSGLDADTVFREAEMNLAIMGARL